MTCYKGRVERLWGTLQDRLTKEMRLAGISAIEDANAFLVGFISRYNERFGRNAANPLDSWVEMGKMPDMAYYFCKRESRKVREDHTISWFGRTLQILPNSRERTLARKSINVHVTPEEEVFIYDGKRRLAYKEISALEKTVHETKPARKAVASLTVDRIRTSRTIHETKPARKAVASSSPESLAKKRAWLFTRSAV